MPESLAQSAPVMTRRQFGAFGASGILAAAIGATTHAQIDVTPPAAGTTPPALPGETVADTAARLGYNTDAIFTFVRDEIAYEPYSGILRGANGTLWSRAGNSADQAELLGALLAASHITYRFASGSLDDSQQDALRTAASRTRDTVLETYDRALLAANATNQSTPEPTLDDIESLRTNGAEAIARARDEEETISSTILDALDRAGVVLPEPVFEILPEMEINQHAWVQVADGPDWTDLDPTLAASGATQPQATATLDEWPNEWHHHVVFAVEGEHLSSGVLVRRQAASLSANSRALADVTVIVGMTSPDALANIGYAITEAVSGQVSAIPWILAHETTAIASSPLAFTIDADSAGGAFGDDALPDDECVAIWLVTTVTGPHAATQKIERALLDRVPPESRLASTIDPTLIAPVPIGSDGEHPDIMTRITILHAELARTPPISAIERAEADGQLGASMALGAALASLRDGIGGGVELHHDSWSFPSGPGITAFHLDPGDPNDPETPMVLRSDLLHHPRNVLTIAGGAPGGSTHPLLRSGVLDAVTESMFLSPPDLDDLGIPETGASIATIFAAAAAEGVPVRAVLSRADLDSLDLTPEAKWRMGIALDAGHVLVTLAQPVDLNGSPAFGWWAVDPLTGRTWDQLSDGTGGASVRLGHARSLMALSPLPEYGVLMNSINAVLERRLLCLMGALIVRNVLLAILALIATRPALSVDARLVIAVGGAAAGGMGSGLLATCG